MASSQKNDEYDDGFVLPTEMLAPAHLCASSSSSSDDDDADNDKNSNEKIKSDRQKKPSTYLAPFVATPCGDAKFLAQVLKRHDLLLVDSADKFTLCDIGCGDGSFLMSLAKEVSSATASKKAIRAIGFDIDEEVIDAAKKIVETQIKRVDVEPHFVVADVCKFLSAEELIVFLGEKCCCAPTLQIHGIYIYLFPEAMQRIQGMIAMLIEYFRKSTSLKWIVTRRWKFDLGEKMKLVEEAKQDDLSSAPFYIYKVV